MSINIKTKNKKGFSLMEVMLSIFVLSVGLVTLVTLMSKGLKVSMEARNQIIAVQLAQEGIEIAENLRDTRRLNRENYDLHNLITHGDSDVIDIGDTSTTTSGGTIFDYSDVLNSNPGQCLYQKVSGSDTCTTRYELLYDPALGYQYGMGTPSGFVREILFWYPGVVDGAGVYSSLYTCDYGAISMVRWGDISGSPFNSVSRLDCNVTNKCAIARIDFEGERDPDNPKCGPIDTANPLIDYSP